MSRDTGVIASYYSGSLCNRLAITGRVPCYDRLSTTQLSLEKTLQIVPRFLLFDKSKIFRVNPHGRS